MRYKISTRDRIGMALDVLKIFASFGIDIIAMEVEPGAIYIRFPGGDYPRFSPLILQLDGVFNIEEIPSLPHEQRRREIQAIVEAVGDGLVAVDATGCITLFNAAAEGILRLKAAEVLGKNIASVLGQGLPIVETLRNGRSYDNQEAINGKGGPPYIISSRPLLDEEGRVYGAVASLKGQGQVRALVQSVTRAPEITFADITYQSNSMKDLVVMGKLVANSDAAVLISGESGTGKELIARAIHAASRRRVEAFVPINCAALPDALMESELFGYEAGSFTGSSRGGRMGLFEFGHGGTVFLDEIAELPTHLQPKLLRALQSGSIRRVGSNEEIQVDVRIVAATNKDLAKLVRQQKFREDLYYRLNVIPLQIPPLRQRREDIPALVERMLQRGKGRIAPAAMTVLTQYHWPGNVRELENVIERALTIADGQEIQIEHLMLEGGIPSSGDTLREKVADLEGRLVAEALRKHGSTRQAGKALGLSHTSIINKVKRYNLETIYSKRKE